MDGLSISKIIKERNICRIMVFGSGSYWNNIKDYIESNLIKSLIENIDCFLDNDNTKWGTKVDGLEITNPNNIVDIKDELFILVASSFYDEISNQLNKLGLIEDYHYTKDVQAFIAILNSKEIEKSALPFKNIHKGKRAFIIGNGPSLKIEDLNKLKNEITFGCNKIYLAFDQTNWRPNYFVAVDSVFIEDDVDKIKELDIIKFLTIESVNLFRNENQNIIYLNHIEFEYIGDEIKYDFSTDIAKGVYGGWTVTYIMMQIAFYMGISELYLLGVDFKYNIPNPTGELSKYGEIILRGESERNHFHKDYRKENDRWTLPRLNEQYKAYLCARETFEKYNRKIYNATRSTALDVFPIVDLDSIL